MLLAIDIGNTNINLGIFQSGRLVKRFVLPTGNKDYAVFLKKICRAHKIDNAVICSVVPEAKHKLCQDLRILGIKSYIIGKDIKAPIKNLYRKPAQVGQDRLVNAYAVSVFYNAPLVVVDFGTAVTFDLVSKQGGYLGGLILPGLQLSLDALADHTALLPALKLARPKEFIGRDTKNSILSGVVYGLAAAVDDLCRRLKRKIGVNARVIATGGNADIIRNFCRQVDSTDRDLTLKGINLIFCRDRTLSCPPRDSIICCPYNDTKRKI